MRMVTGDEVHRLLDYPSLVEGLKAFHLQDIDDSDSIHMHQPLDSGSDSVFLLLPAWQREQAIGVKLITVFPDNEYNGSGLPSVQGVYALFDGKDGRPLAVIDGTALTLRKTAADSATGASYLARQDAATMLMVGAGAMAPHLIMAHLAVRPSMTEVLVWNRNGARAEALAGDLKLEGVAITATDDLEGAARRADVISCATMAEQPIILGAWLKLGCHLDLVGSYQPQMRECDDEAMLRGRVYLDSRFFALEKTGEFCQPIAAGLFSPEDVCGDLFQLARGTAAGRGSSEEITVFKNAGGGHLDLGTARFLLGRLQD